MNKPSDRPYQIETLSDGVWTWRMESLTRGYLNSRGRDWVDLRFCEDYRITEKT